MTLYSPYSAIVSALTLSTTGAPMHPRLFLLSPRVVFAGQVVVLDPPDYPVSYFAYGSVSVGSFGDVKPGMTVIMGSSLHGDDLGRQRVKSATTISIFVGRSSQGTHDGELTLVDGAFFEIWDDRRVWSKMPFIDDGGESFKDGDLEVLDRTTFPPPVANMGAGYASTVDPDSGVITVLHNGQGSYATAAGATIVSWAWDIADGILIGGTLTSDNITVEYPPGYRYTGLTVTDSNGKSATTERIVVADDLDHSLSFDGFTIESHTVTDAGVRLTIRALVDMPRAISPDGTPALIWLHDFAGAAERTQMLVIGWLDTEDTTIGAGRNGLLRDTTLTILDVAARLDQLPGFPQAVADDETRNVAKIPTITWNYMISPTMDLYMHYLWAWHSTALEVADFIWSGTGSAYAIAIKNSDGDSLWNQAWRIAQAMCPGYVLTCDQAGAIRVVPDPQLQDIADRTSVIQAAITEDAYSDLRFGYQRAPRIHWLRTGALVVQTSISFNPIPAGAPAGTLPTVNLPTVFSIAPGTTPGQGLGESENNEQLVSSQAVLNSATGHKYARLNAATGLLTLTLIQDDGAPGIVAHWREIEPALKQWVTVDLGAAYAAQRGLTFSTVRCLPKEVSTRYGVGKAGLLRTIEITLEPETSGQPGKTVLKPIDVPAVGEDPAVIPPAIPPPDDGLIGGQELVAGIGQYKVYRTSDFTTPSGSGGPTWDAVDLTGSDEILTWVVDPFSPGYLTGVGTIDGWLATATKLYRVTDIFGTPVVTTQVTFATTALCRTIQASFGTYFVTGSNPWLVCISYYGSAVGHTGTWCTYSVDGGATWSAEVLVSSFYDSGGASNPIGLYTSPKTPGLAYTIAHVATANPATTGGYVSTDWGATWSLMAAAEDPAFPLPFMGTFHGELPATIGAVTMVWSDDGRRIARLSDICSIVTGSSTNQKKNRAIIVAAPINTKQMTISGSVEIGTNWSGFGSASGNLFVTQNGGSGFTRTTISDVNNGASGNHSNYVRSFVFRYDFATWASADWPHNRDLVEAIGSGLVMSDTSIRFEVDLLSNATVSTDIQAILSISIDEIVLDSGVTYAPHSPGVFIPVHGQGGEIYSPWAATEDVLFYGSLDRTGAPVFGLQRATSGTVDDVSPAGGMGINHGHFAVRADDSDATFMLAAVNNATQQAVYGSVDGGSSWTAIVAPATGSQPYSAAFGLDETEIFIWGPAQHITFSNDSGATNDDRSGNLGALSATKFIGIAGGPVAP